jgi:mannosyltransferase
MRTTQRRVSSLRSASASVAWARLVALLAYPAVLLFGLTLLALILRLYKLSYYDYFDDEVITTFASRPPVGQILSSVANYSVHPPLYYILVHLWGVVGTDLISLRLLSVFVSSACVPAIYWLGRELTASSQVGLVAAALMAINPFQIYHSQQARMYPLLTLVVVLAAIMFVRAWREGGWLRWAGFSFIVTAGLYTHVYFPFSLLGLNLAALFSSFERRTFDTKRWIGLIAAQVVASAAFLPFLPQLFGTVNSVVDWYWIVRATPFAWVTALFSVSNFATVDTSLQIQLATWQSLILYGPAIVVMVLTFDFSIRQAWRKPKERDSWALLHFLIWTPIVVATLISLTLKPILLDRSLIAISAPLYLLMAWLLVRFWPRRVVQVVAVVFLTSILVSLAAMYPNTRRPNSLIRLAHFIATEQRPGDAVVFADWQGFETTAMLYPSLDDVYILPAPSASKAQWVSESDWAGRLAYIGWHSPQNVQPAAQFAPRYRRIWIVFTRYSQNLDFQVQTNQGWLNEHGRQVQKLDFERAVLYLYEMTP